MCTGADRRYRGGLAAWNFRVAMGIEAFFRSQMLDRVVDALERRPDTPRLTVSRAFRIRTGERDGRAVRPSREDSFG